MYEVNYLGVLLAAVANMVVGMVWYSPGVFGKKWMRLSGLTVEKMEAMKAKGMTAAYLAAFISSLVAAYVLAHFAAVWGATNAGMALEVAFWIWLGFIATTLLGSVLWEGKPLKLYFLNAVYYLVAFSVMAVVLTWF